MMRDTHKVFFIIITSSKFYIKDILMSRFQCHEINDYSTEELSSIAKYICSQHDIHLSNEETDNMMNIFNISLDNICCILQKVKLLKPHENKSFSKLCMHELLGLIDYNLFDTFFTYITEEKFNLAYGILNDIYIKGYDIGDILYFMYQYLKYKIQYAEDKNDLNHHKVIERLCFHINEIYNGHNDKTMLIFFTLDIYEIYHQNLKLNQVIL